MNFHIYSSSQPRELKNFPTENLITTPEDLAKVVQYSHTAAKYENNERMGNNFIKADVLIADVDNKKGVQNRNVLQAVIKKFEKYEFYIVFSKSTDFESGKYSFHLYFPIGKDVEKDKWVELQRKLLAFEGPEYFDPAVKDAARCFFGTPHYQKNRIIHHPGECIIDDIKDIKIESISSNIRKEDNEQIVYYEGVRNPSIFDICTKYYKAGYSETEILEFAKVINRTRCIPPLPEKEVINIVKSAKNYKPEYVIIRNYIKIDGKTQPLLKRSETMERPSVYFESFETVSDKLLIDKKSGKVIKNTDELANILAEYNYLVDFKSGMPYTLKRYFEDLKNISRKYERFSLNWETDADYKTKILSDIEPKKTGLFRKLLDIYSVKDIKDKYRVGAAMISGFLGRNFDGKKPGFGIIAPWRSSGKTSLANSIVEIVQGMSARQITWGSGEEYVIHSVKEVAEKYVIVDNIVNLGKYKRETDRIVSYITSPTLPYWEMHVTHDRVYNNKTFIATLNDTQQLNADLLERFIIINMKDGRDISSEEKIDIIEKLNWFQKNRKEVVADILWHIQHPSNKNIKIKPHMKFVNFSNFVAKVLADVFPEVDTFDFWLSNSDMELDEEITLFEEYIEKVLELNKSGEVSLDTMMDIWRIQYGDYDRYSKSKRLLAKYINRIIRSSRKYKIDIYYTRDADRKRLTMYKITKIEYQK